MKILIASTFFPPLNSIASLRPYSWAKEWARQGHDITVLTTEKQQDPSTSLNLGCGGFTTIEVPQPSLIAHAKKAYDSKGSQKGIKGSLSSLFHRARQRLGIFNACRMPDFADLWIRPALKAIRNERRYDVIVSSAGPYSVHLLAYFIKKNGIALKWVADYRDTWSDNYFYPGLFPINILEKVLEGKILKSAELITTVSEPFTQSFIGKYKRSSVVTVPNGFDPEDLETIDKIPAFPNDHKFRIVHTGSIYFKKRDPTPLFLAIAELSRSHTKLLDSLEVLFVGSNQANLQELIEQYQVGQWVKQLGFVSRERALAMQRDANALLFLPWNDPNIDGIITGKIFEYLYARTPIIAVGASHMEESQKMIIEANAGKTFHSVEEVSSFLINALQSPETFKTSVDENILKKYNRTVIANDFLELIKS